MWSGVPTLAAANGSVKRTAQATSVGRPFPGRTFWIYMFVYGVSRFIIEMFRGDPRGFVFGTPLSTSQFISVILVPLSLIMLFVLSRRSPSPAAEMRAAA